MTGFYLVLFGVAFILTLLVILVLKGGAKNEAKEAADKRAQEVQNDIRLSDVAKANDIRKRVDAVPDRLPPSDTTGPPTEKRKGRRGAL
jgi:Flp pilus assembly protein TadB